MKPILAVAAVVFTLSACTTHTTNDTVTTNGETVSKQTTATTVATANPDVPKTTLKNPDNSMLEFTRSQDGASVQVFFDGKELNLIRQQDIPGERYAGESGYEFSIQQPTYTLTQNGTVRFTHTQP
jgi:hypothetical protein